MKKRVIRIKDVSQIDTSKISVYDLNNRYIDPFGNLFGLRYDRIRKKVSVIKLERIHTSQAVHYQKKLAKAREWEAADEENYSAGREAPESSSMEDDEIFFDPDTFIEKIVNDAETHKERINGIIMNIHESDIFPKENKMESSEFDDIARKLDIDGIQQLEKLDNYYRELSNYPRSITYYQAKIDKEGKDMIDIFGGNKSKTMRFIFLFEMSTAIKRVYKGLHKHIEILNDFTQGKNVDEISTISKHQKQSFNDARISIENTLSDIDEILKTNNLLMSYAMEPDNY